MRDRLSGFTTALLLPIILAELLQPGFANPHSAGNGIPFNIKTGSNSIVTEEKSVVVLTLSQLSKIALWLTKLEIEDLRLHVHFEQMLPILASRGDEEGEGQNADGSGTDNEFSQEKAQKEKDKTEIYISAIEKALVAPLDKLYMEEFKKNLKIKMAVTHFAEEQKEFILERFTDIKNILGEEESKKRANALFALHKVHTKAKEFHELIDLLEENNHFKMALEHLAPLSTPERTLFISAQMCAILRSRILGILRVEEEDEDRDGVVEGRPADHKERSFVNRRLAELKDRTGNLSRLDVGYYVSLADQLEIKWLKFSGILGQLSWFKRGMPWLDEENKIKGKAPIIYDHFPTKLHEVEKELVHIGPVYFVEEHEKMTDLFLINAEDGRLETKEDMQELMEFLEMISKYDGLLDFGLFFYLIKSCFEKEYINKFSAEVIEDSLLEEIGPVNIYHEEAEMIKIDMETTDQQEGNRRQESTFVTSQQHHSAMVKIYSKLIALARQKYRELGKVEMEKTYEEVIVKRCKEMGDVKMAKTYEEVIGKVEKMLQFYSSSGPSMVQLS